MTKAPTRSVDRSGLWAVLSLWIGAVVVVMVLGLEVQDGPLKRQVGHWVALVWAFIGWLPALFLARARPGGKDGP